MMGTLVLAGCQTTSHQYAGPQRGADEIGVVRGVSVVQGVGDNPNVVMLAWKVDGQVPQSEQAMTHAWGLLPGAHELGVAVSLGTLLPVTLRQFQGTYWIPLNVEAGYVYDLYSESIDGRAPKEVCALKTPRAAWPARIKAGEPLPAGVLVAACGTPRNPVESYALKPCSGVGSCPVKDEFIKP